MARKRKPRTLKKSILLFVDGETEQAYFEYFKTSSIHILPELPEKKSLQKIYKEFKDIYENSQA